MRALLCVAAALAVWSAACGGGPPSAAPCAGCAGCCSSGVCQAGTSDAACGTGGAVCSSCGSGQACQAGACAPTSSASPVGAKCAADADCGTGFICAAGVPGGGYCTKDCTASGACPAGARCSAVSATEKLCLETCGPASPCRAEHLCLSGLCLPKCTRDAECGSANCDLASGTCRSSRVGNACAADADCGDKPAFCASAQGGYCSLPCGGDPNTVAPCPGGSNCVSLGGTGSACLKACGSAGDCRPGELCAGGGSGVLSCVPKCTADSACGPTFKCDAGSGACVPAGPAAGQLGGPCAQNAECSSLGAGAVCATAASGYPGGYCTLSCAASSSACGAAGTCVTFGSGGQYCLSKCAVSRDCRAAYYCYALGGSSGGVCTPTCTSNADCAAGLACDTSSGACVTPSTGSSSLTTIDLTPAGPVAVHTGTLSAPITVTIPSGAVSVTFVGLSAADPTALIVVYRIESPDGRIYDYATPGSPMKVLPPHGAGSFSVLVPNSPTVPFTPGTWTLRLLASKETTATVQALVKSTTQVPLTTGRIKLNLFFAGMPGISAATAPTDANFKAIVQAVKNIWGQVGITVVDGDITYSDLTGADLARFQDLKDADLGALVQTSSKFPVNDGAMNVFFVNSITASDGLAGYIILGESAGIPGVPLRGTSGSGLAVTTADFPRGLADIADTWAHEGGHWLGLFHTTESAGTAFDPLPDTPQCAAQPNDLNGDHVLQPQECANLDAPNLMFWTSVASIPNAHLSADQQFVLLRNPSVH